LSIERSIFMKRFTCPICEYVHKGEKPPPYCPQCRCVGKQFSFTDDKADDYIDEILVQTDKPSGSPGNGVNGDSGEKPDITETIRSNFTDECAEVGMYLTMSRLAQREGYSEAAEAFRRAAFEEAAHAARFAELCGLYTGSTAQNLAAAAEAENAASEKKLLLAKAAKDADIDEVHDAVHEMARDDSRRAKMFGGLLKRYFG